ncbi:hypothetical protein D6C98_07661 [Aureobasidium pullulans]|nr:hypothetical protein D6C98_07661 [Aureobasidium pullulans]
MGKDSFAPAQHRVSAPSSQERETRGPDLDTSTHEGHKAIASLRRCLRSFLWSSDFVPPLLSSLALCWMPMFAKVDKFTDCTM